MLIEIGALASKKMDGQDIKVIMLEVIMSAMRVHKYDYANVTAKISRIDWRTLDAKSIRTMNRLTRQVAIF